MLVTFIQNENKMALMEILIKGTGSLEKDLLKVCFQIVELISYIAIIHFLIGGS